MSNFVYKEEGFENLEEAFQKEKKDPLKTKEELDYYFGSYSQIYIHHDMLSDEIRTKSYQHAIINNKHLFKDKIVLDIGVGTGILSMFAVSAGAKHVYGIEKASIYNLAKEIIKENKMQDKITLFNSLMEETELPEKVDIIISEWMGYLLYFEGMFDSVHFAAKKYLKPNGMLFPNKATMSISGYYCNKQNKFKNRSNIRDLILPNLKLSKISEPKENFANQYKEAENKYVSIEVLNSNKVKTNSSVIKNFDFENIEIKDLDFKNDFELVVQDEGYLNGFVLFWSTSFTHGDKKIVLDTSPFKQRTHWKQGLFALKEKIPVFVGDIIYGTFYFQKNVDEKRNVDVRIDYKMSNQHGEFTDKMYYLFQQLIVNLYQLDQI